jgi:hypothetical protein
MFTKCKRAWNYFVELCAFLAMMSVLSVPIVAWGTHIIYSIMVEKYLLLIAGAILPPIGMIHGVGVWFGWF